MFNVGVGETQLGQAGQSPECSVKGTGFILVMPHDTRTGGEPGSAGQDRILGQPGLAACGHSLTGPFPASPCSGRLCLNRCSLQRGWFKHQARRFPSNNHHFSHQDNHPSQAQGHGPLLDLPGAPSHGPQGDACLNSG